MNGAVWARTNRLTHCGSIGSRLRFRLVLHLHMTHVPHVFLRHHGFSRQRRTRRHSRLHMWAERGNQEAASLTEQQSSRHDSGCYEPLMHRTSGHSLQELSLEYSRWLVSSPSVVFRTSR